MSDAEKQMKELAEALTVVRETNEKIQELESKGLGGQAELKEKMEKANAALDALEAKNQEITVKQAKEAKEAQERIEELEAKMAKMGTSNFGGGNMDLDVEVKALKDYASNGEIDKKYLRSDSNVEGGFLMRRVYDDMILKKITEVSPIREVARNKRIDALSMKLASRETLVTSYWTAEGETPFTKSNSTYAQPEITAHSLTTATEATNAALLGSEWDLDTEITGDFAESRAQIMGAGYVTGNGVKKPRGFLDATAGVPTYNSGSSGTYDFDDLIELTGQLKTGYNPMYGMNRRELAYVRTLKDGAGAYIWRSGNLGAGIPNAINGEPYIIIPDMPDKAADNTPIIYADFAKLYTIVDSFQAILLRNPYKKNGFVEFTLESWTGGDVVLPEAGVLLKLSV
jgi:HK97 family phage major capsid protein